MPVNDGIIYFTLIMFLILGIVYVYYKNEHRKIRIWGEEQERKRENELLNTVTNRHRGTWSEQDLVLKLLNLGIKPTAIFHDLYLRIHYGSYCQIDLVVATKVGLLVFEVKDYSGWIFGNGYQHQWTQVLNYGKMKNQFYNPIKQNEGHILNLRKSCEQFEYLPIYSVIVFYGDSTFRDLSNIPKNTYVIKSWQIQEVINEILTQNQPAMYTNKREVVGILKRAVENGESLNIQTKHIKNIRGILNKHQSYY